MTPERRKLHAEAMAAFKAARAAFESNPRPGTPEWQHWQQLCQAAMNANDAYIRALASASHGPAVHRNAGN